MAQPRADSGEIVKKGKPPRRFPWRLWIYAILMSGAAGAGGYFAWHYRGQAMTADDDLAAAKANLVKAESGASSAAKQVVDQGKQIADEKVALDTAKKHGTELENQLGEISKNLNASKDELAALRAQKAETEKRMAAIEDIQKQFAKMTDTGQLKVTARRGNLVLSLPSEVLFASGSAELSKEGELRVLEVGITLKKLTDRRVLVVGHTDDQPLGKAKVDTRAFADNWELSTARALTVTRFLVQAGMDPKNLIPAGAGEHDPIATNKDVKERARNRRIEIALLPALEELPPLPASLGK